MNLLSFIYREQARYGCLQGDGETVLSFAEGTPDVPVSLLALIESEVDPKQLFSATTPSLETLALSEVRLLPPLLPSAIFGVGLNYIDHAEELGLDPGTHPTIFLRLARNHVGHNAPLIVPAQTHTLDWEGELAVVIGRGGRHIAPEDAMAHVFGYTICNEATVREHQNHSSQFTMGKNFDQAGAFGPTLVTADQFGNPYEKQIVTKIDGETMQDAPVSLMAHKIHEVIAYLSSSMCLKPGDIICTGTPKGVGAGMKPQRFLRAGEVVEVSITDIGTLSNPVQDEVR